MTEDDLQECYSTESRYMMRQREMKKRKETSAERKCAVAIVLAFNVCLKMIFDDLRLTRNVKQISCFC